MEYQIDFFDYLILTKFTTKVQVSRKLKLGISIRIYRSFPIFTR